MLAFRLPLWMATLAAIAVGVGFWQASRHSALAEEYHYRFSAVHSGPKINALANEIAFYQQRLQNNPHSALDWAALAAVYLRKARVSGQSGWYLLAEQAAKRSLATLPVYNSGAVLSLAEIDQARHDFSAALTKIQLVLQQEPGHGGALSLRASVFLALGNIEAALNDVQALVQHLPNLDNLTLRALVYEARGQTELALADFRKALSLEEPEAYMGSARTRSLLARFYLRQGNHGMAQALLQEALRITPNWPQALLLQAQLLESQKRYRLAQIAYQKLLDQSHGTPSTFDHWAWHGLARMATQLGQGNANELWQNAETLLRQEVQVGAFGHRRELARLLLERGQPQDLPEALQQAQAEVRLRQDAETLRIYALALWKNQQLKPAQQVMQQVLRSGIKDAAIFSQAAEIEQALGNLDAAQALQQQAHQVNPAWQRLVGTQGE